MTCRRRAVGLLLVALLAAPAARAQQRWVEAAGVAKAEPGEGRGGPGRQAALRAALSEAVQQVAIELLTASETASGKPPPDPAAIAERVSKALGGDPSAYVSRFQIREDRGVQPRLLLADPDAKAEYQLMVNAQVDVAKVRQKIGARALPPAEAEPGAVPTKAPTPETPEKHDEASFSSFDLELDQLATYKQYAAVREALLGKIGARRAEPTEFTRGRALLALDSPVPAPGLALALNKALEGQLSLEAVPGAAGAPEGRLHLRVKAAPVPLPTPARLTP
jgi:hypothetical protein